MRSVFIKLTPRNFPGRRPHVFASLKVFFASPAKSLWSSTVPATVVGFCARASSIRMSSHYDKCGFRAGNARAYHASRICPRCPTGSAVCPGRTPNRRP